MEDTDGDTDEEAEDLKQPGGETATQMSLEEQRAVAQRIKQGLEKESGNDAAEVLPLILSAVVLLASCHAAAVESPGGLAGIRVSRNPQT